MIHAKPKVSTLFSVGVFLILVFGLFAYSLSGFLESDKTSTLNTILVGSSGAIGLTIALKTLLGIKLMQIAKERFSLNYPFRFKKVKFTGKEIEYWKIDQIKTFGGMYEELLWKTKSGKEYSISKQEHTDFDKAKAYMLKKFKKIQKA